MNEAEMIELHKKESKKKIEKARPVYWIISRQSGKKAGYQKIERATEMVAEFKDVFPNEDFYIEREMPVDGLVVAASYIGTNNKNNETMPFKGWVGDYAKKRMAALYGEKSNFIEKQ